MIPIPSVIHWVFTGIVVLVGTGKVRTPSADWVVGVVPQLIVHLLLEQRKMGIVRELDMSQTVTAPAAKAPLKKATGWLNFGPEVQVPDGNGGTETVFITLFGVPLSELEIAEPYTGKSERMRLINEIKIRLQTQLKEALASMNPGDASPVRGLVGEVRKVGVPQPVVDPEDYVLSQLGAVMKIG
jgi:hypothetical protein